jgi:hypothetical protein
VIAIKSIMIISYLSIAENFEVHNIFQMRAAGNKYSSEPVLMNMLK